MKKIVTLLFMALVSSYCFAQLPNYYYYKNQQQGVNLSNTEMFLKFVPNLSNAQKQGILSQAEVKISEGDSTNLGDVVRIRSKITRTITWVYPCGILNRGFNYFYNYKPDTFSIFQKPAPCVGCPPPPPSCLPYSITTITNNIETAITDLAFNPYVRSVSKAIQIADESGIAYVGTCEDFYVKLKPNFSIESLLPEISNIALTYSDQSTKLGIGIYKFELDNSNSKNCIAITNAIFQTGIVEISTPNFYNNVSLTSADPSWINQWNLNPASINTNGPADIRVEPAWVLSKGAGIKVAVLDNGVDITHLDLQGNVLPGYNAITDVQSLTAGAINTALDRDDHGTACAGIIAAVSDNNLNIAGVAPQSKIIPVKIFSNENNVITGNIVPGIIWAWRNGADVISCSFRTSIASDVIDNAIKEASIMGRGNKGCIVVIASGNRDGNVTNYYMSPISRSDDAIAVGAITRKNERKWWNNGENPGNIFTSIHWGSAYGEQLDVVAPGDNIPALSFDPVPNSTIWFNGTSAACPNVSGVAALVLAANPNLTFPEVKRILQYSCNKVGPYCYNWTPNHPDGPWNIEMGYGRINAYNAVQLAMQATSFSIPAYNIPQNNFALTSNTAINLLVQSAPCAIFSGGLLGYRYEVTKEITFSYTPNPLIICSSNGWSAANPNGGKNYADVKSLTNTSATLRTYVYSSFNYAGQSLGFYPTHPNNIKFNYSIIGNSNNIIYQQLRGNTFESQKINFEFDDPRFTNDIIVEFEKNQNELTISPNPTNSFTFIAVNRFSKLQIKKIDLLNSNGVLLRTLIFDKKYISNVPIDVSMISAGIYFLRIQTDKKVIIKKIIKQ